MPIAGGVTVKGQMAGGPAHLAGLVACKNVHICPSCAPIIRSRRQDQLDAYATAWQEAGFGVALLTLTMRHYKRQDLKTLVKIQREAWRSAIGAGGRPWGRIETRWGIVGMLRGWEATWGETYGWHPHWHVLVFTLRPLDEISAADLEDTVRTRWNAAVKRAGGYTPGQRSTRVDIPSTDKDAGQLARYIMKNQSGKARVTTMKPGAEMNRSDLKQGRRGGRQPFEILDSAGEQIAAAAKAARERGETFDSYGVIHDVQLWREYESGVHGVRAMHWTTGMEDLLQGLSGESDLTVEEILEEDQEGTEAIAVIPPRTWAKHIRPWPERKVSLCEAAEKHGQLGIRVLCRRWGLVWGVDILPPPEIVDAPDATEENRVRSARTQGLARPVVRSEARLPARRATRDVGTETAVRPVQERLSAPETEPARPSFDELAAIRSRMNAASQAARRAREDQEHARALPVVDPPE